MAKEMYIAMVRMENMQGADGSYPDLILVEAEDQKEAVKLVTQHIPSHPRWQKSSKLRIVMVLSYKTAMGTKLIGERKRIVRTTHKRRRRKRHDSV